MEYIINYRGRRPKKLGEKGIKESSLHSSQDGTPIPRRKSENYQGIAEIVKEELKIKSFFENI